MNYPGALRGIDTDEIFRQIEKLITGALEGSRQIIAVRRMMCLPKAVLFPDGQRGYFITGHLALGSYLLCRPADKQQTFALFDEWVAEQQED